MTDNYSETLVAHALATYDARLERPWKRHPGCAALVHADNGKMFALLANVAASSLGLAGDGRHDIVTVRGARGVPASLSEALE